MLLICKNTSARCASAIAGACLAFAALAAVAQTPPDPARGSLILDQRNDEFGLQLRQWQQQHEIERATGGDPTVRREMETLHLQQRQRQDALHSRQLLDYDASAIRRAPSSGVGGPQPMPYDRTRFARERAEQALHQDYELDELERSTEAKPAEEVPHWGPTLTDPSK
ncbi:MAG: hypothetical protein LJE97_14215 [Betaproteobacteria bacterium]|jgi:hypothetical protein|nr:hypothetical protein [Betaproteobacteria bacterium]